MGCGGGGGSSSTASNNEIPSTNPTDPQQNIPNASIATVIQGIIAIPSSPTNSLLKTSSSRAHFALLSVDLTEKRKDPLANVTVKMKVTRDDGTGVGQREVLVLDESITDAQGRYEIEVTQSKLEELSRLSGGLINTVAELYQSSSYRLEISMDRPALGFIPPISKKVQFRPTHNNRPLGGSSKDPALTVNAMIDIKNSSNLSLEVMNTEELKEKESLLEQYITEAPTDWNPREWQPEQLSERLVIKESVDLNGNGLLDELNPLVLFEKPQIEAGKPKIINRKVVRVFEIDADNNGNFAEKSDETPASVFGGTSSTTKVASFVDLESDGRINEESELKASNIDLNKPFIEFVGLNNRDIVIGNLPIEVRFCDCNGFDSSGQPTGLGLGYDITSLKVYFPRSRVEFLNPSRFTLAPNTDIAQPYFSIVSDGGTSGSANFVLQNVNFAFGSVINHTIAAEIKDFAGNSFKQEIDFIVNGQPQIIAENSYIVGEGNSTFTTTIVVLDVDPLEVVLETVSGDSVPPYIYLTAAGEGPTTIITNLPSIGDRSTLFLNVIPGYDFGLESDPVLRLTVNDGVSLITQPITIRAKATNTPSDFNGICWVNDPTIIPHPFSANPQNVCTVIGNPSLEQTFCRTGADTAISIPENELSKFVLCGSELDSEDFVFYTYESILTQNASTATADIPQFDEEFFFKSPTALEYYINPVDNSILPTSDRTRSTISSFEWKPLGNQFPNENTLTFRATDGKGSDDCLVVPCQTSKPMSIILSVTTVQDPPEIVSVSTAGLRTGIFPSTRIYGEPYIVSVENDPDFFEGYRTSSNGSLIFKAQQGQPIQIEFTATDDETPTGSNLPTLLLADAPAWIDTIQVSPNNNYRLRIGGSPTLNDALETQTIKVETQDPTGQTVATTYTFKIETLDQNEKPYFNNSSSEALSLENISLSPQEAVTLSIDATEDEELTFYIHAYDIDPQDSPYHNPENFFFSYNNASINQLGTSPNPIVPMEHVPGNTYLSARISWTPRTEDTNESVPEGVAVRKQSKILTEVTARCPSDFNLIDNCIDKINTIDLRINVLSVDEPPHFMELFNNKQQIFELDGSVHRDALIVLNEGKEVEIQQLTVDEENQPVNSIEVVDYDTSLLNLITNQDVYLNPNASEASYIIMTGLPVVKDYVNIAEGVEGTPICSIPLWVQPEVESVCAPQIVTMELEVLNSIASTGATTSRTKLLQFQVVDVADPPIFVEPSTHDPSSRDSNNLVNKLISGFQTPVATEDISFRLDIAVFNKVDKNPAFWDGYNFSITKFPEPPGNMSIQSDLNNTTATTATITWNPTQDHVSGTGSKQHEIIVQACKRDPNSLNPVDIIANTCKEQTYRINVLPTNDPPKILFGEQLRNLASDPITASNPFNVSEDSKFERPVRVEDEDGQEVNLQVTFQLASSNPNVNSRDSGDILSSPSEVIVPADDTPVVAAAGDSFVEQLVSWSSIDWDDISLTSTTPQYAATYIMTLTANTPDDSSDTGEFTTEVYLEVLSVNDAPRFTTGIIPTIIGQSTGPGGTGTSLVIDFLNIIENEEGDDLRITLVDKGTAVNFLTDVGEDQTNERTRVLYLSDTPGQDGVGDHQLQVEVVEKNTTPPVFAIAELTLKISDSNDTPSWEVNPLFTGSFPLQEGQSKVEDLIVVDPDLFSNPESENLTFSVKGSFDSAFVSFDTLFSDGQNYATTASMAFVGTTQPPIELTDRQPFNFRFTPLRVENAADPFAVTTYYLQFKVTDQFLNDECGSPSVSTCPKSAIQTIAFEITPRDDTPVFTKVNSQAIPIKEIIPICFDTSNSCSSQTEFITLESVSTVTVSVTAQDQETESLSFNFSQLGTDITTTSEVINLVLANTPISLTPTNPNTPDSIELTFSPTNINVGLERFTMKVQDTSDSSGTSRNSTRLSTRTFSMLIQNVADAPYLETMIHEEIDLETMIHQEIDVTDSASVTPIIFYEDTVNNLIIDIDDLDLHLPIAFSAEERTILSSSYNLGTTQINDLESQLFPKEFFSYTIENLTTFPGLQLVNNSNNQVLFQYASPQGIAVTSTTDVIKLSWTPSDDFSFTNDVNVTNGNNGNHDLQFLVKSFSSNSVISTKPTSLATVIKIRVWPVNDKPKILNTELETAATQDIPFSFTINGDDEEDTVLTYFFEGDPPGDMTFQGNKIAWNPANSDTTTSVYNLKVYAEDSGLVSRDNASLTGSPNTEPLSSEIYNLKVFLNNVDDPVIRDLGVNPLTETAEDQQYVSYLKYTDPDYNDVLVFSLHESPLGMDIQSNLEPGEPSDSYRATITWTPPTPGTFDVIVKIESRSQTAIKSTVYYPYSIKVNPVNDAPRIISAPIANLVENQPYLYDINVTDEDDPSVNLRLIPADIPPLYECDDPEDPVDGYGAYVKLFAADRKLQGTTNLAGWEDQEKSLSGGVVKSYNVCIEATDGLAYDIQDFKLIIQADNNPPTIDLLETFSDYPGGTNATQSDSVLLVEREPLSYSSPSSREVTLYQGYLNYIHLTFSDEEGDTPIDYTVVEGPGANVTQINLAANSSTLVLSWTPDSNSITNPPQFKIRATDARFRQTEFLFNTKVIDTPDTPTCAFNKATPYANEDEAHILNLECSDPDLTSNLSYSIVTNSNVTLHPVEPIFNSNVLGNANLQLQVNNQGQVTFLPKIADPIEANPSTPSIVPVTFSVCGTSRNKPNFHTDCLIVDYAYDILERNDEPLFEPSIPSNVKTTASEGLFADGYGYRGGISPGLTFRFVKSSDPCPPETSQEICIRDEETEEDADLNSNGKVALSIKEPNIIPSGLQLSNYTPSCYPTPPGFNCLTGTSPNFSCDTGGACGTVSSKLTYVQTLTWNNIDFSQPTILNLQVEAKEREDSSKTSIFNFSMQIANNNRGPYLKNRNPLNRSIINESETFTFDLQPITTEEDGDPVSYSIVKGVTGMTINTNTGLVNWTPNVSHIGDHLVQYSVIDIPNSGEPIRYTTDHQITVQRKNTPPLIDPLLRKRLDSSVAIQPIATEGQLFEARILAKDEEGDAFSFYPDLSTLNGNELPPEFSLTDQGEIIWIPTNADVGPASLIAVVEDTKSGSQSSQTFIITVKNVNNPPVITNKIISNDDNPTLSLNEKQLFTYIFNVTDQDAGEFLTYSVTADDALSATISNLGVLSMTPNANSGGPNENPKSYPVFVTVTDSNGSTDTNELTILVVETNNAPVVEPVAEPLYVYRQASWQYQLYASDPENDAITYEFVATPLDGAITIGTSNGILQIDDPSSITAQTVDFQVRARDSKGLLSDPVLVKLQLTDGIPPLVTSLPSKVGRVLSPYTYDISSNAVNFTVKLVQGPLGMVVPQNSTTLSWTPDFNQEAGIDQSGVHIVVLRVQADVGGQTLESEPQRFELSINKENDAPTLEYTKDLNNVPINTYGAIQGIGFLATVLKLSDSNLEDLARLDFYFANTNKSKTATANPKSAAIAQLTERANSARIENGKAVKEIDLTWTPDNDAAFAVANGQNNRFTIIASDGITESTSITIDFNVTNTNDPPILNLDENQGGTEIGFVDQVYTRDFFARDIDNQKIDFCLDLTKFLDPLILDTANRYPSLLPIDTLPQGNVLNGKGILKFTGAGETKVNGNLPANHICTEGLEVLDDPTPERGKLSKATLVWTPDDTYIERDPYAGLTLTLYDTAIPVQLDNAFNLKLAPVIDNLVPDIQYIGEEVAISGGGIVATPNQLNVKFIRSDGSISAVTQVYDLDIRGKGKFRVPQGATTGFVSVGFTSFSSPVPFTVLNGRTNTLIGSTNEDQDLLSIPAGIASTYVTADTAILFVSNRDYHCVQAYKYTPQETKLLGIVSGQLGNYGDFDGNETVSMLNSPTGLSLAHYNGDHYILVADTMNNKIKAVDVSDLIDDKLYDATWSTMTYTIAESKHLNRPYKAVQHSNPTSSEFFFIANTFGNTIELLYTGLQPFGSLPLREINEGSTTYLKSSTSIKLNIGDPNVTGSRNTYTIAGSGHARSDILGNVFHPVDLQIIEDGGPHRLVVSSYSNYKYSLNSSFRLYKGQEADRNNRNANNIAQPFEVKDFNIDSISLAKYGLETLYDGDILLVSSSNHNSLITSNGIQSLQITTKDNQTDLGRFYITGADTYFTEPKTLAENLNQDSKDTDTLNLAEIPSRQKSFYQTYELEFSTSVVDSAMVSNPINGNDKAAAYIKYDTKEVAVTQVNEQGFYSISGAIVTTLPAELDKKTVGVPTYYDTNRDGISDLWLPVPDLGKVFVFPGQKGDFPNAPLSFDMQNYWYFTSNSISLECEAVDCLRGINKVGFGRIIPTVGLQDSHTSTSVVNGQDMLLINPFQKQIIAFDGYAWTYDGTAAGHSAVGSLPDNRFHIDRDPSVAGANSFLPPLSGPTEVNFRCQFDACLTLGGAPAGYPYFRFTMDLDNPPEDVCVGSFTMHPFQQKCKFGGEETECAKDGENPHAPSDIEYSYKLDNTTTPTFEEMKNDLTKLEQMLVTFSSAVGQSVKPVRLVILLSGGDRVSVDLPIATATAPQCGEPFSRPDLDLKSLKYGGITSDAQPLSVNGLDERKVDSVFYIDGTGQFQMFDFADGVTGPTLYPIPTLRNFATEATTIKLPDGKAITSSNDFLLVDINGDLIKDLISLHPVDKKLIITLGTGNPAGALFNSLDATTVQALDTLADPHSIDVITVDRTDPLRDAPHIVDIVVTNLGASSVTVFEHRNEEEESPGNWYKPGISFEMGDVANMYGKAVIETDSIFTGKGDTTSSGNIVWDRYYYGNHAASKFYFTGVRETEYSTKGIIAIQSNPAKNASVLTALPLTSSTIFRSTRGFGVTPDPETLSSIDLNRDGVNDLITRDPKNGFFTTILSNSNSALTYNQKPNSYLTERTGGIAFGDMDNRKDLNDSFTTDIIVSNFDKSTITVYYNGGVPLSPDTTSEFSFSHPDFPSKTLSVGRGPRGLTVADLNQDGILDIAVANKISDNVSIIYGKDTNPVTYEKAVFYSVGNSPVSIIAMPVRTHSKSNNPILDLVTVNNGGESISVIFNKASTNSVVKGFDKPRTVKISEYSPSHHRTIDSTSGAIIDPFVESPFLYESGDFGNLTSYTASILRSLPEVTSKIALDSNYAHQFETETYRYDNLVIGYRSMLYNVKNIGMKEHSAHRSAISSFIINANSSLSLESMVSFEAESVVKSLVTSGDGYLYFTLNSISERTHTLETSSNESQILSATLYRLNTTETLIARDPTQISTNIPYSSNFNLLNEELGAGLEAMSYAPNHGSGNDSIFAAHSGENKGILRLDGLSSGNLQTTYVVNTLRQNPNISINSETVFSDQIQLNRPGGMTVDFNNLSLLSIDRGNEFIRVTDLKDSVTRTMRLRDSDQPTLTNVVDITNQTNTFNYYAISSDRKLYLINPSNYPISVTTESFESSIFQNSPHSSLQWFEVKSYQNNLYIAARNDDDHPTDGYLYPIDLETKQIGTPIHFEGGLNGFDIDSTGNILYYSDAKNYQIKMLDLSDSTSTPVTIAGFNGLSGHYDGPSSIALINKPRDVILNQSGSVLYFIDGSCVRSINLDNSITGEYDVATISGDPFRTGIINSDGQQALFIRPAYLHYEFRDSKDVLYIADELAHNIRRVEVNP